jgi:hypothetical protein
MRRALIILGVALAVPACSTDRGSPAAHARVPPPASSPATGAPSHAADESTTTSVPPATSPVRATHPPSAPQATSGFDATAAPVLRNTGTDYVSVFRSLDAYRGWLERHHPDPALVATVWVPNTEVAQRFTAELTDLRGRHLRRVDVGDRSIAKLVSVVDHQVSLTVEEYVERVEWIDPAGRVVARASHAPVTHLIVLLDRDASGRWSIADVTYRITNDTQVVL